MPKETRPQYPGSGSVFKSGKELGHFPVAEKVTAFVDSLSPEQLQTELSCFIQSQLHKPEIQSPALDILEKNWDQQLHLVDPLTDEKTPVNLSLEPVIISREAEKGLRVFTQATNIARAAVLMSIQENQDLKSYLEFGVDPLAVEIMNANPFTPMKAQWRWRGDTQTRATAENMWDAGTKWVENNGGEPQGDGIISYAAQGLEMVLPLLLEMNDGSQIKLSPYPKEQMMKVMKARWRIASGSSTHPRIGYQAWTGRSSLSRTEAEYTARHYEERYETSAVAFSPFDIVDIIEHEGENGSPSFYTLIVTNNDKTNGHGETVEVDIVRRLLGEPFEHMDLWRDFKEGIGRNSCSDGKATIWERYIENLSAQMINPLNSWATDKKIDAILGNREMLEQFGIFEKIDEILESTELSKQLSISSAVRSAGVEGVKAILEHSIPKAFPLRKTSDGLFEGDNSCTELCLSDSDIEFIKQNPEEFVLKRDTLKGHSGTSVHVGSSIQLNELDFEDYLALPEADIVILTELTKEEFQNAWKNGVVSQDSIVGRHMVPIDPNLSLGELAQTQIRSVIKQRSENGHFSPGELTALQKRAWSAIVTNSLEQPDCIIQRRIDTFDVSATMFIPDKETDDPRLVNASVHHDVDPQSIGIGTYTYPVVRESSAAKTNITGGYGGFGVPMGETMARKILSYAISSGIHEMNQT